MQNKLRLAGISSLNLTVNIKFVPEFQNLRFPVGKVSPHGEISLGQIQSPIIFTFSHLNQTTLIFSVFKTLCKM